MFFQSIAATVNKFAPQLQVRAKAEIMNVITNLELLNISQQNAMTNYPNASFTQVSNTQFQPNYSSTNNFVPNDVHSGTCTDRSQPYFQNSQQVFSPHYSCTDSANVQCSRPHSNENSNSIRSNFNSPLYTESSQSPTTNSDF